MDAVLAPASADAAIIAQMAWVLIAGAALVFGCVMLLMGLSLRRRAGTLRPGLWIVGGGLLLPIAVLSALMAYNVRRSTQLATQTSQGALVVSVTARMWWWEVRYRDPSGGTDIVLANELHLPAGRPVYLALTSTDVIHSFWVPALAGKMDMVPGRMTGLALRPSRPGVYRGQCAEYCGLQHARMALHVVVEPPAAFGAWLAHQARPQPSPFTRATAANGHDGRSVADGEASARLALGRSAFDRHCAACHAVRTAISGSESGAAPARASLPGAGPDLTHVASRMYLAAGTLRNDPGALAAWIADPHVHKRGVRMPAAAGMDPASLQALAAYLEQLK